MNEGIEQLQAAALCYRADTKAYSVLGSIRAVTHPTEPYVLFNYTEEATFQGRWNAAERVSRGLIINYETGALVALPFGKFWNLEERPETSLLNLPGGNCEITAKADGSLGILYWTKEGPTIATRGSFTSDQALWATEFLRRRYNLASLDRDVTLLFEIIYPENRVVLDYDIMQDLVLIGARNMSDEFDYRHYAVRHFGLLYGFTVVPFIGQATLDEITPFMGALQGIEGFVARFPGGLRVKVKTDEYKRLHRIVSSLNLKHVRELLLSGGNAWESYPAGLPDEYYKEAARLAERMIAVVNQKYRFIQLYYQTIAGAAERSRKDYALAVKEFYPEYSAYLFAMLDGKDVWSMILKGIRLEEVDF
jgi:RNA ligase